MIHSPHTSTVVHEPARSIPVSGDYDVIVVGGGIAGVAAAVAAARQQVRVCLLEKQFGLGGLATLGNVTTWLPICDGMGHQVIAGIGEELLKLSVADLTADLNSAAFRRIPDCWLSGGDPQERTKKRYLTDFNPASYMLALEQWLIDAGVELLYDTHFCAVHHDGDRISHVIVENKSGRSAMACRSVIDATGDADVCHLAGERTQSLDSNVPAGWFYSLRDGQLRRHTLSNRYCPQATQAGGQGPFFRGDDAHDVTAHVLQSRRRIRETMAKFAAENPGHDAHLLMPPMMACFRMTRRLIGQFTLGECHIHQWFDDAIGLTGDWRRRGPVYALPLRCMLGANNRNLLAVGRCISADTTVWDVTRAIPTCAVTGEAAGAAAAMAARDAQGDLFALDVATVQKRLLSQGAIIDAHLLTTASPDDATSR